MLQNFYYYDYFYDFLLLLLEFCVRACVFYLSIFGEREESQKRVGYTFSDLPKMEWEFQARGRVTHATPEKKKTFFIYFLLI